MSNDPKDNDTRVIDVDDDVSHDLGTSHDLDTTPVCIPRAPTNGLNPIGPRTATNEMQPALKPLRVELDLDDPGSLADFFDHLARLIRDRKRIIVTIE